MLREKLVDNRHELKCHYCGVDEDEGEFRRIWGKKFYGREARGKRLEIDHLDPKIKDIDLENPDLSNLVFACAVCNMAKSNIFYPDEFKRIGIIIREIWEERKRTGRKPVQDV
jgi:hypothetical protein